MARTAAIVGFLTAGFLILAIGFFVGSRRQLPRVDSVPALHLLSPGTGAALSNPVTLRFATQAPLRLDRATGWTANELHLHAMADTVEIMPAPDDISMHSDSIYEWRLPPLAPGPHRLYLTWAARHHGNLRGPSDTILVYIRP